jgi:hypothetical protein
VTSSKLWATFVQCAQFIGKRSIHSELFGSAPVRAIGLIHVTGQNLFV